MRLVARCVGMLLLLSSFSETRAADERPGSPPEGSLSASARLPRSRSAETLLAAARQHLQNGRPAEALDPLAGLLAGEQGFLATEEHWADSRALANRLIAALPRAQLDLYERQYGAAAQRSLSAAVRSHRISDVWEVAVRYRNTRAGLDALRRLSAWHFVRGEFELAAGGYAQVREHPLADAPIRRTALLRQTVALIESGDAAKAVTALEAVRGEFGERTNSIGGKPGEVHAWLDSRLQESSGTERDAGSSEPEGLPSLDPVWSYEPPLPEDIEERIATALDEAVEYGVAPLAGSVPLVAGDVVVSRTLTELAGIKVSTGELLWQRPASGTMSDVLRNPERLGGGAGDEFAEQVLLPRLLASPLYQTMTAERDAVFLIEPVPREAARPGTEAEGTADQPEPRNRLIACELGTGLELWNIDAVTIAAGESPRECYFLGPPLVVDESLLLIGQFGTELRLLALAQGNGECEWSLLLAEAPRHLANDPRRQHLACPVQMMSGQLICPTAAGLVVAVDPLTRTRIWAYRYSVDHFQPKHEPSALLDSRPVQDRWWHGWKDVALATAGGMLIIASPESEFLHALDAATGELRWRRPRGEGQFLAGIAERGVLIGEKYGLAALDAETGELRWTAGTGPPAGRGFAAAMHYYLPLAEGAVARVEITKGTIERTHPVFDNPPGHLVSCRGGMLVQSPHRLSRLAPLQRRLSQVVDALVTDPVDPDLLESAARLSREAGDFAAAAVSLRRLREHDDDESIDERLRQALIGELHAHPDRLEMIAAEIEPLLSSPEEQIAWRHAVAVTRRDPNAALQAYFRLLELNPSGEFLAARGPKRLVRFDRQVQAEVADLLARTRSPELEELQAAFQAELSRAGRSQDPFALQRLAEHFHQVPWVRETRIRLAAGAGIGVHFLRSELALLEMAADRDHATAASALYALAKLMEERRSPVDAAARYRRLLAEFPNVALDENRTAAEIVRQLPEESPVAARIHGGPADPWPLRQPAQSTRQQINFAVYQWRVPVDAERGSLLDRLDVAYEHRTGRKVRFSGDGHRGSWELELPRSRFPFRSSVEVVRGWGLGDLLILRAGTDLFGIAALDENCEPNARIVWTLDTMGERPVNLSRTRLDTTDDPSGSGDDHTFFDGFDRPIGRVGPVLPGYVCYQQRGKLIAVDPLSGAKLWERFDLPEGTVCTGDEEFVLLFQPGSRSLEVLRSIDGATVQTGTLPGPPAGVVLCRGRDAIVQESRDARFHLARVDLISGATRWALSFPIGSQPVPVDQESLLVVQPDGTLQLLSIREGGVVAEHRINMPLRLERVETVIDERRIYIAVSGPVLSQRALQVNQIHGGFRNPLIDGTLLAIDRYTGEKLWSTRLENESFPLDQPKVAPFLVLHYRTPDPEALQSDTAISVVRCLDKRTGEIVLDYRGGIGDIYTTVLPDFEQEWIDLQLPRQTIRFDYSGRPEPVPESEDRPADAEAPANAP